MEETIHDHSSHDSANTVANWFTSSNFSSVYLSPNIKRIRKEAPSSHCRDLPPHPWKSGAFVFPYRFPCSKGWWTVDHLRSTRCFMITRITFWKTLVKEVQVVEWLVDVSHQVDEEKEIHRLGVGVEQRSTSSSFTAFWSIFVTSIFNIDTTLDVDESSLECFPSWKKREEKTYTRL